MYNKEYFPKIKVLITVLTGNQWGFHGGSDGKESTCSVGDLGSIPRFGRSPGEGNGNPLQYSCLENTHEQRGLAGYSLWDHKELDTTEHSTSQVNNNQNELD